jgi:hypothetical protein
VSDAEEGSTVELICKTPCAGMLLQNHHGGHVPDRVQG